MPGPPPNGLSSTFLCLLTEKSLRLIKVRFSKLPEIKDLKYDENYFEEKKYLLCLRQWIKFF